MAMSPETAPAVKHEASDRVNLSIFDPEVQTCPWAYYRQLHQHERVYREPGTDVWVVAGYTEVRQVLSNPATFSNVMKVRPGTDPAVLARHQARLAERGWPLLQTVQRADPPEHGRHRRLLNRIFTPSRVAAMAPHIDEVVNELIDAFAADGGCELISQFCIPLPAIITSEQLGLPRDGARTFRRWVEAMHAPHMKPHNEEELVTIADIELESQHYFANLFEERRAAPRDDIISALVRVGGEDAQPLETVELLSFVRHLMVGGFMTTVGAIAHGVWLLLRHPEQMALLRSDVDRYLRGFIEESLRLESVVQGFSRRATRSVELGGVTIPEDGVLIVRVGAANRDETVFPDAERFDITRQPDTAHVAFGHGIHFCLGAGLARQEMASAFNGLLSRLDDLELAGAGPTYDPHLPELQISALPLRFTAHTPA